MNKFSIILCALLGSLVFFMAELPATTIRVATYNIWNPVFEGKYSHQDTWDSRRHYVGENILAADSDVLCLEEVGIRAYTDLLGNPAIRNRYASFYVSHAPSKEGQSEGRDGLAFFYKPEKVSLVKMVQSTDGTRPTHRRDFFVDLELNEKRERPIRFRVACTHLDADKDLSIGNGQLSALVQDVLSKDLETDIDFVVLCGDFNEGEHEGEEGLQRPRYAIMDQAGFITDGSTAATRPEALNVRHKGHVDWIYFKRLSSVNMELVALSPIGDEKASDHKLTQTEVKIKHDRTIER